MAEAAAPGRRRGGGTQVRRPRPEHWNDTVQQAFLAHLAATANVSASARAAGMTDQTCYRHRRSDAGFRAAWAAALDEGYVRLEAMLLRRAINGTFKTVWHSGKRVGRQKEYPERLALHLMSRHRPAVMAGRAAAEEEDVAATRARIEARLAEMNRRLGGQG